MARTIDTDAIARLVARARREVDEGLLPSAQVALALNGEVILDETFGEASPESRYCVFSSTKPFVAGAVWTLVTPARHALSRWHERRADQFALALTGQGEAFVAAIRRLAEQHLAEERPSRVTRWFTHRHPSIEERLAMAGRR